MVFQVLKRNTKIEAKHYKRKVLLIGDGAVGKTSLIRKFVTDKFDDKYIATIGTKVTKKELELKGPGQNIFLTMMIWDVLGQKGYTSIQAASFKGADGVILVCDFTRADTLGSLEDYWIPNIGDNLSKLHFVFAANKSDLKDKAQFSMNDVEMIASRYDSKAYSCSAKSGENVEDMFTSLGKMLIKGPKPQKIIDVPEQMDLPESMSIVEATDLIINDFCNSYGDMEIAMPVIRQQFTRAGMDIRNPTIHGLRKVIELLVHVESDFKGESDTKKNYSRRKLILSRVKH
jgi:small GTP-binding protein